MPAAREAPPIKVHLSINVANLKRSLAFYEAFFGVGPHKVRPGYANFDMDEPPLKFALNQHPVQPGIGALSHLGFQVPSAAHVEAAKERLRTAGLATFDEADTTCCYARQDKIWAHDPDGNAWEIYVLTDDLLDDHERDHAGNLLAIEDIAESPALAIPARRPAGIEPGPPICCPDSLG
jgi:catechol 2,3-dioxygenase-like lactoylglutathione lyase family enzyme